MEATLAARDAVIGQLRRELQAARANLDVSLRWGWCDCEWLHRTVASSVVSSVQKAVQGI